VTTEKQVFEEKHVARQIADQLESIFGDTQLGNEIMRWSKLTPEERAQAQEQRQREEAEDEAERFRLNPDLRRYFFSPTETFDLSDLADARLDDSDRPHVHEWRAYIPEGLRERWGELSDETRQVAYYMACEQADREVWD